MSELIKMLLEDGFTEAEALEVLELVEIGYSIDAAMQYHME